MKKSQKSNSRSKLQKLKKQLHEEKEKVRQAKEQAEAVRKLLDKEREEG